MNHLPTLDANEIRLGELLGTGAFSSVYRFSLRKQRSWETRQMAEAKAKPQLETVSKVLGCSSSTIDTQEDGSSSSSTSMQQPLEVKHQQASSSALWTNAADLVIKKISDESFFNPRQAVISSREMLKEVQMLASLPHHPNIISLHGVSTDFWRNASYSTKNSSYCNTGFLVLERLTITLDQALVQWYQDTHKGVLFQKLSRKHLTQKSQAERIHNVGVSVANALAFLHRNGVVYRDLKPCNIGFDQDGTVKLFDFSTARNIGHSGQHKPLSGRVGTLRYMAPENARGRPYSFPADVYSYGLVLWELCTLHKPWKNAIDRLELMEFVTSDEHPCLHRRTIASKLIRNLLQDCWDIEPAKRPSFELILATLRSEVGSQL